MSTAPSSSVSPDFLISGSDYLAANPGFKLIGRQDDLNAAFDVLLRKTTGNNLVLHGQGGVGLSSLVMAMQASKQDPSTPFDIVGKEFFFLDVDALFASSDAKTITEGFQKAMDTLQKSPDSVLIIEDTKGFLDGVENNNVSSIINVLMRTIKTDPHFQTVFVSADRDLQALYDSHADISKIFTLQNVQEPSKDDLRAILENAAKGMEEKYDVTISKEALDSVTDLTRKYPGLTLGMAQPKRSIVILEGALTAYCRDANARPPGMDALEETLKVVTTALDTGSSAEGELAGKSQAELSAIKLETEKTIKELTEDWSGRQDEIREIYSERLKAEVEIQKIDARIAELREKEATAKKALEDAREEYAATEEMPDEAAKKDAQKAIREEYKNKTGKDLVIADKEEKKSITGTFNKNKLASAGFTSAEVGQLQDARKPFEEELRKNEERYAELTKDASTALTLKDDSVLAEFSRLSKIDMNKLKQDDGEKLLRLEETIKQRVFGQDKAVEAVAKAVRRGKAGLKKPNKPIGTFLFLGPTGVGKTELAKAVTEALFGNEEAMHVYNMPEYSEKNAVNKMIGSPQGFQGYDEGGLLTNDMMRQPSCVNLFDEAEKAHVDMFDLLLRIADEGRLSDNHGREVFFGDSINILTSNIGAKYFLDPELSFEKAKEKAMKDLYRHTDPNDPTKEVGFRPEFLKRLDGIYCFNRLDSGQIELIAVKSLKELNGWLAEKGMSVEMPEADLKNMCKDNYRPEDGARGVMHYIADTITSDVADTILMSADKDKHGVVNVSYTPGQVTANDEAEIRRDIDNDDAFLIRKNVEDQFTAKSLDLIKREVEKEFAEEFNKAAGNESQREAVENKINAKVRERAEERVEEKVREQIEALVKVKLQERARERAKISTSFKPEGTPKPVAQAPANSNKPSKKKVLG